MGISGWWEVMRRRGVREEKWREIVLEDRVYAFGNNVERNGSHFTNTS
jgi:hypothetical protein